MKKRALCLLFSALFALSLMAGCGTASEGSASESAVSEATVSETVATPEESAATEELPAEVSVAEEAPAEEPSAAISYPIGDGSETITFWTTIPGNQTDIFPNGYNDHFLIDYVEEALGVNIDITSVAQIGMGDTTAFDLMIASGDWPDLLSMGNYAGGLAQAYSDGVIIELEEEMLEENAPDYYSQLTSLSPSDIRATQVDGNWYAFYSFAVGDTSDASRGCVIRTDWLDELGLDVPKTIDDLTVTLKAFKDKYDPKYTYFIEADADLVYICAPFNTYTVGYFNGGNLPVYRQGDEVMVSWATDEYRTFLEWFKECYDYGIFEPSFYVTASDESANRYSYLINGQIGVYEDSPTSIADWRQYALEGEEVEVSFYANLVDDEGKNTWGDEQQVLGQTNTSITANCKDPELAMQVLNYFFTEEGAILANYGVEGYTFNYNDDGEVEYTEVITNSDYQLSMRALHGLYCWNLFASISYNDAMYPMYTEEVMEAIDIMSEGEITAEHYYPSAISLTADESEAIITKVTDITTYAQEQLLSFMVGQKALDDTSWKTFVDQLYAMGLQDCIDVYQNAYDEYQAGER